MHVSKLYNRVSNMCSFASAASSPLCVSIKAGLLLTPSVSELVSNQLTVLAGTSSERNGLQGCYPPLGFSTAGRSRTQDSFFERQHSCMNSCRRVPAASSTFKAETPGRAPPGDQTRDTSASGLIDRPPTNQWFDDAKSAVYTFSKAHLNTQIPSQKLA